MSEQEPIFPEMPAPLPERELTGEGKRAVKCENCGEYFETTHPRQKFCSVRCQTDERNERRRDETAAKCSVFEPKNRPCEQCGKMIEGAIHRQRFCAPCRKQRKLASEAERYLRKKAARPPAEVTP